jgi:hypothetical protein
MFDLVAYVALAAVVIWGAVSLIKHFVPDYYARMEDRYNTTLHKRIGAIEDHLGITTETNTIIKHLEKELEK